jgi:arabinofuranosyltransferase
MYATLCLAALVILRNAWMADDAYITLRTVDNFCQGRGLTYNPGERVQVYTHPLWMFCLAIVYFFTREHYFSFILLSVVTSLCALWLFIRMNPSKPYVALAFVLALVSTRAFADYSTSGLENPMTHLLLVLFFGTYFSDKTAAVSRLTFLGSLLALNRMDSILLVLPTLLSVFLREIRSGRSLTSLLKGVLLGASPFLAWELFSLIYYGSLVPNTALAKLGAGVPRSRLMLQGLYYLLDALERDPLTLVVIALAALGSLKGRDPKDLPVLGGAWFYLAYIVSVGGDFMSGRFLTPPLLLSCMLLCRLLPAGIHSAKWAALAAIALGLAAPRPTFLLDTNESTKKEMKGPRGVADEQAFWYRDSGLLTASKKRKLPTGEQRKAGEKSSPDKALEVGPAGYRGFFAPPGVFLLDHNAIVDAFLARLPARRKNWRPGHFRRRIPEGYPETLVSGHIHLKDKKYIALYQDVQLVIRGPLLSSERFAAISRLHFKDYKIK